MFNKYKAQRRLSFEVLENRSLLAANLAATFDSGVLRVEGTSNADQIVVHKVGNEIQVNSLVVKDAAGKIVNVPVNKLTSVSIDSLGGNDLVWVKGNLAFPIQLKTGTGADFVAVGPATPITSSDIGSTDLKVNTATGIWKQLESATRDPQGTFTINKLDIPSGIPGLPNVNVTNAKFTVTADSIQLVTGTFTLPVVGGTVTLSGAINKYGQFNLASVPADRKIGAFNLKNFKATLTNDKITFEGGVQHKFLGNSPIVVTGVVNVNSGTYSLEGKVPDRKLFNGNLELTKQTVTLDKDGLKFKGDAKLTKLGITTTFKGTLAVDGKYSLTGGFHGSLAGVSVSANDVFTWDSDAGIKVNFKGTFAGMPADSSGTSDYSFSGTYGPDNWSITGKYNKPINLGYVTLTDITVTVNKNTVNGNDFLEVSCIASYNGWKALANVKGTARIYRDGRYKFTAVGSLIDTAQLSSNFGGYKVSETTLITTNMKVTQKTTGTVAEYVIDEKVKTGIVSSVFTGKFKAGGFDLSKFSGTINTGGYYKLQSVDRIPLPWGGVNITKTTVYLEKGKGLTLVSTADIGLYRFNVTGNISPSGKLTITNSGNGTISGFAISSSSLRGEFDSSNGKYSLTISGDVSTPFGSAGIRTTLNGTGSVAAPTVIVTVNLSGAITKLFTGSVTVTLDSNPSFRGNVAIKGLGISKSISGTISANGTLMINGVSFKPAGLSDPTTAARVLKAIGVTGPLDIAKVLVNIGAGASAIVNALGPDGLKFGWQTIADSLWNSGAMAGKNALDLAKVMVNEGATAVDVADAFDDKLHFGWRTIADSLWNSGAMSGKFALDLAKVMVNEGATAVDVADAFDDKLHFGWTTIAGSLWNSGAMSGKGPNDLARILWNEGAGSFELAGALFSSNGANLDIYNTARALYNSGLGLDSFDVASALFNGAGRGYSDVARALYKSAGLNLSLNDTASALFNGIGGITFLRALEIVRSIA